jgi:hypothetical protein
LLRGMNWKDYEFIREMPPEPGEKLPDELTGWETIIFELMDDEDDEE